MLDKKTEIFLDNIIKGASNEELYRASRAPSGNFVDQQTQPQKEIVIEADAKVRPIEFSDQYKIQSKQTPEYVENVNRAVEQRQQDKIANAMNARESYEKQTENELKLGNIVNQALDSRKPYQRDPELQKALSAARAQSENLQKAPERDMTSEMILSFAPAAFGLLGGEYAAISQLEGGKKARELYEARRKEQAESVKSQNEQIMKKYEQLVKIDSALADDWLAKQKLDAEQARLGADILKFSVGTSQKDVQKAEDLANRAAQDVLESTVKASGEAAKMESEPEKERQKNKRAAIVAKGMVLKEATNLRKEFESLPEVKDFRQMQTSYGKISTVAKNPSAAGDISLVFNYMKMLDPSSTVREGEYATAKNATGVPDQIRNTFNKLKSGQFLSPSQRQDFLNQSRNIYNSQQELVSEREKDYGDSLAQSYGADPKNVVPRNTKPLEKEMSAVDKQALDWAKKNPKDPRADKILKKLGVK